MGTGGCRIAGSGDRPACHRTGRASCRPTGNRVGAAPAGTKPTPSSWAGSRGSAMPAPGRHGRSAARACAKPAAGDGTLSGISTTAGSARAHRIRFATCVPASNSGPPGQTAPRTRVLRVRVPRGLVLRGGARRDRARRGRQGLAPLARAPRLVPSGSHRGRPPRRPTPPAAAPRRPFRALRSAPRRGSLTGVAVRPVDPTSMAGAAVIVGPVTAAASHQTPAGGRRRLVAFRLASVQPPPTCAREGKAGEARRPGPTSARRGQTRYGSGHRPSHASCRAPAHLAARP